MGLTKYFLSKTGLFPRWEPHAEDVLNAANLVFEIKNLHNSHGRWFYYVIPESSDPRLLVKITRLFRANGVILRPHRSKNYKSLVLRVPDREQKFIKDVMTVRQDRTKFQDILAKYTNAHAPKPKENSK
jgi:hypothetical protein